MSIGTIYVQASSKAALNARLIADRGIPGNIYTPHSMTRERVENMPVGTVVKIFDKFIGGTPYAKAYGIIAKKKDGTVYVK